MFKRIIILTLCLLMAVMAQPAQAADSANPGDALYLLVERIGGKDVVLGTGVLFRQQDQILTTSNACSSSSALTAIGMDGVHRVASITQLTSTGVALLTLEKPSSQTPLQLAPDSSSPRSLLLGSTPSATPHASVVTSSRLTMYLAQPALQVFTRDLLLPGAILVDDLGRLAGLSMANLAEGQYASAVLLAAGLEAALQAKPMTQQLARDNWLSPVLTLEKGNLLADWSGDMRDSGVYIMFVMGLTNNYYTAYVYEATSAKGEVPLAPGHDYAVMVQWAPDKDQQTTEGMWTRAQRISVPATAFTDYAFTDSCWLCSAPAGAESPAEPEKTRVATLTRAELANPTQAYFLQIVNTYQVTQSVSLPMTVSITAPGGSFYFEEYGYVFDPALQDRDAFAMEVTALLKECASLAGDAAPAGEYTLSYSIGGQVAGTYTFTVTAPAE